MSRKILGFYPHNKIRHAGDLVIGHISIHLKEAIAITDLEPQNICFCEATTSLTYKTSAKNFIIQEFDFELTVDKDIEFRKLKTETEI